MMGELAETNSFAIAPPTLDVMRAEFDADRTDEERVFDTIRTTYENTGFLADPHTAVGLAIAARQAVPDVPMVTLATAHAAKFPDAVRAAAGVEPRFPNRFAGVMTAIEDYNLLRADRDTIESFILARSRAVAKAA